MSRGKGKPPHLKPMLLRVRRKLARAKKWAYGLYLRVFKVVAESVGKFIPKQSNLVILGAMKGGLYGDNSKYLFEWMLENRPEVRCVWVTHSEKVHSDLRMRGLPVYKTHSVQGLCAALRASVGVFTNSLSDLALHPEVVPDSIRLIALRHGQPVKRLRFARKAHKIDPTEAQSRRREGRLIRYAISTSKLISDLQEECLQIGREKHIVTGYPRNDCLLEIPESHRRRWMQYMDDVSPRKVILYAPTWRHGRTATRFFPFDDFDEQELVRILENNDSCLLLRPYVHDLGYPQLRRFLARLAQHHCIRLATHREFTDVNSFLPFVDILISDYSSLYHAFLLLNRPMLFIPYDYDDFEKQNGFLYDYFENLPGPAVYTFRQFLDQLIPMLNGRDDYLNKRVALKNKIHTFQDANSCMRVADLVTRLLEEA